MPIETSSSPAICAGDRRFANKSSTCASQRVRLSSAASPLSITERQGTEREQTTAIAGCRSSSGQASSKIQWPLVALRRKQQFGLAHAYSKKLCIPPGRM